ncbi:MAG: hypothetical protein ACJAS4_001165 [Bacteriovoracaceae bacterium]|jgi:hypothetical protein
MNFWIKVTILSTLLSCEGSDRPDIDSSDDNKNDNISTDYVCFDDDNNTYGNIRGDESNKKNSLNDICQNPNQYECSIFEDLSSIDEGDGNKAFLEGIDIFEYSSDFKDQVICRHIDNNISVEGNNIFAVLEEVKEICMVEIEQLIRIENTKIYVEDDCQSLE